MSPEAIAYAAAHAAMIEYREAEAALHTATLRLHAARKKLDDALSALSRVESCA